MKQTIKIAVTFSILVTVSILSFSQEYKTEIKVTKDQSYNYKTDMVMDITQTVGGQEMKINTSVSATYKNLILDVINGQPKVKSTVWDVQTSMKMMMDTTIKMEGQIGPENIILYSKYGDVMKKEVGENPSGKDLNMGSTANSGGIFCEFPERNVKVGDKWTKEQTDSVANAQLGGKVGINIKKEYTLGAMETIDGKEWQKVTVSSTMEIGGKGHVQGMDLFMEGTGIQKGDIYLDPKTNTVYLSKINTEMDMNIALTGPQSMTIPMTQKITSTQKLIQ